MKCFYHRDLDGHCSGAIVKLQYPECEMYPINHDDRFPWEDISIGETVYMVDFSLQPFDKMIALHEITDLVWIDHHKTAINESEQRGYTIEINGIRDIAVAGCELTWEYFYGRRISKPYAVYLLGRYDVWDWSYESDVYPFQMGMRMMTTDPRSPEALDLWAKLLGPGGPLGHEIDILEQGKTIVEYQEQTNANLAKWLSFEINFEGYKFIAANMPKANSQFFNAVWDDKRHDAMLVFGWTGSQWTVSMFATPEKIEQGIDVGKIAHKQGGGGHTGAAGFQCQELPFY